MLPDICTRPEIGRLTGRGNTANLESVLALKPDLILDVLTLDDLSALYGAKIQRLADTGGDQAFLPE